MALRTTLVAALAGLLGCGRVAVQPAQVVAGQMSAATTVSVRPAVVPVTDAVAPAEPTPRRLTREELSVLADRFALAAPDVGADTPLSLWATHYFIPQVRPTARGFPLRDLDGRNLGPRLSRRDWCAAALQGTVRVFEQPTAGDSADFVTYNFAGTGARVEVDCKREYRALRQARALGRTRFALAVGPFGDGVEEMVLVPFRSIAVDRAVIPYGSVLFVPAARGTPIVLPSGDVIEHDGFFFAADRGGAIKDHHIDVFIGPAEESPFDFVQNTSARPFDAYLVDDADLAAVLRDAHRRPDDEGDAGP